MGKYTSEMFSKLKIGLFEIIIIGLESMIPVYLLATIEGFRPVS